MNYKSAFSQKGEGIERIARQMRGERNTLRILENADNPKYQKVKQMR